MAYAKKFVRPYATYKDRPDKTTPVTADIKNMESDAFESIEEYLSNGVPASDLVADNDHQTVTQAEKNKWNAGGGGAVSSVNGKTGAVVLGASDVGALPDSTTIPSKLSDLSADASHRTVTDTEKQAWNGKLSAETDPTVPAHVKAITESDIEKWNEGGGSSVTVVDNLTSESSTDALSARQGKVLKQAISDASQGFSYNEAEAKLTFSGAIGGSGTTQFVNYDDYGTLKFGVDGEGNYGYFKADDSFVPFKSKSSLYEKIKSFTTISESINCVLLGVGNDKLYSNYKSGAQIGAWIYSTDKIDITDFDTISVKFYATKHYSTNFYVHLYLRTTMQTGDPKNWNDLPNDKSAELNEEVTLTIDVSNYSGEYFLGIAPVGTTCEIYDLKFE